MINIAWLLGLVLLGLMSDLMPLLTPFAFAESFNVKTGAWEVTSTGMTTGMMIPPEIFANMPPDRRAKLEQAMQARSAQPKTHVKKVCITQKDLDQNNLIREEDERDSAQPKSFPSPKANSY